jgi:signal-transduction protein with cAMP-binding, CBS, and nucleotidyltransferase domain
MPIMGSARRVRDAMRAPPPSLPSTAACSAAAALLARTGASQALVVDPVDGLRGTVGERELLHRAAYRLPPEAPVAEVMASPPAVLRAEDFLYAAVTRLRGEGRQEMPVLDGGGTAVGQLALTDALAALSGPLVEGLDRLPKEGSADPQAVRRAQVDLADLLLQREVPAPEIQRLITDINNDLHRRVAQVELDEMALQGWGDPPVGFTLIVMGSSGRGENTLTSDQDNGLILDAYDDARHGGIDPFFIDFSRRLTEALDGLGIPLCRGNVMATNPVWRKSLPQWRAQLDGWVRARSSVTLRLCDIFFDFEAAYGDPARATGLRHYVTNRVRGNHPFLSAMYNAMADNSVAVDRFGRLVRETEDEIHRGQINLKYMGLVPLVESVRLLALREGVEEAGTLDRLAALHRTGHLDADERDYLAAAHRLMSTLVLRRQVADLKAGLAPSSWVAPGELTRRERHDLAAGLGAVRRLRERVRSIFTAEL